jgi:tRNA-splicing ligase RtcB
MTHNYTHIQAKGNHPGRVKAWINNVPVEPEAMTQLLNVAGLPFIHKHVAAMPDVHFGRGATVGSVIPTKGAIIPAAVGVDIGCGMVAVRTDLTSHDLPENLHDLRSAIEAAVPVGFNSHTDESLPPTAEEEWKFLAVDYARRADFDIITGSKVHPIHQLGTLGGGNHFIELCLDENDNVWIMLHSGSRGIGNRIGSYYIEQAKREMERYFIHLPDKDLAYIVEGSQMFDDYSFRLDWAQRYAFSNRKVMLDAVVKAMSLHFKPFTLTEEAINCHHNYVEKENHFGSNVWVTRKGAVRAREGDLGIIPGSMGARSYIVRGKGNPDSFCSCSHGAGRAMSRTEAKRRFTLEDHKKAVEGIECRVDEAVIDETPAAYKDIDAVMAAQSDLVDVVHTLKQILCVKG